MQKRTFILFSFSIILSLQAFSQTRGNDLVGYWITEDNNAIIKCYNDEGEYFARVIWYGPFKKENLDKLTPSERKKTSTRFLNNLVLKNFVFEDNEWSQGKIVQVYEDKTYSAFINEINPNEMKITGYLFFRWLSESTIIKKIAPTDHRIPKN
jgi:uncharacterized protein (DUF2147 family)